MISYEWKFRFGAAAWCVIVVAGCLPPLPIWGRIAIPAAMLVGGLVFSAYCTWWRPRVRAGVPIFLMLHSVSETVVDPTCANNTLRPSELERLILDLKTAGYTFQRAGDAVERPVRRGVVLTFDDGYLDNYTDLFPILRRQQVPATCFVTSQGATNPAYLTPAQIREMEASGLVEFGGHTAHHTVLDQVAPDVATREIIDNAKWLEHVLGHAPTLFAYPCGGYTDAIVEAVKAAGYRYAFTMHKKMRPVSADPMRVHRQIIPRGVTPLQAYMLVTRGRYRL